MCEPVDLAIGNRDVLLHSKMYKLSSQSVQYGCGSGCETGPVLVVRYAFLEVFMSTGDQHSTRTFASFCST